MDLGIHPYPASEAWPVQLLEDGADDTGRAVEGIAATDSTGN